MCMLRYLHLLLKLQFQQLHVDHDKIEARRCLIFIEACLTNTAFFLEELNLGVLIKAESCHASLQVKRVDLQIF